MSCMHYNIFELIEERGIRKHKGGCQCGEVRFEVFAPSQVTVVECSCESCQKRQTRFFEVSSDHFRLVQGHAVLSTFGSYQIKHSFCTKCGVQCFCVPSADNSTNDTIGVMPHCLDAGTMRKIKVQKGVGKHTDSAMKCLQPSTDRQR